MRISYDSLTKIVANQKAYRGRPNQYPTHGNSYRRHGHKCFSPDVIDSEVIYRIYYGKRWSKVVCTEDEAKMLEKLGKQINQHNKLKFNQHLGIYEETEDIEYYYHNVEPNEVGIVRPDNTFELTEEDDLGQGVRHYLSEYVFGYSDVRADCRRGGVILDFKYPLFKGLRINLDKMTPAEDQKIELFKKVVNRSAAKELYAPYQEMFSVSKAMFSQMGDEVFIQSLKDVLNDNGVVWEWDSEKGHLTNFTQGNDVVKIADRLREEGSYFDSAMLYGYGYDLHGIQWRIRHNHKWINKQAFVDMDRMLRKIVYQHKKPFDLKSVDYGSGSTSEWGFVLKHNDLYVNQYRY